MPDMEFFNNLAANTQDLNRPGRYFLILSPLLILLQFLAVIIKYDQVFVSQFLAELLDKERFNEISSENMHSILVSAYDDGKKAHQRMKHGLIHGASF